MNSQSLLKIIRNMSSGGRILTLETLNPKIKIMEYAVRGPLNIRAGQIEKELLKGKEKPFKKVIKANIGDCHAMGQKPITFIRQVLALVTYNNLLKNPNFPEDAKQRAQDILSGCKGGSIGSYSESSGIEIIRRHVSKYIERRDEGIPSSYHNIVLCGGASNGIGEILKLFICDIDGKKPGVMVPIPQYPLYSATLAEFGMHQIGYFLNESKNWELSISELKRAIGEARKKCNPRAIVVINPGNPTGQVLTRKNIEEIIKFAHQERLFLLADEVYQYNIYAEGSEFHSFKKVMTQMGAPYKDMELASFMSASKCYMGECGIRGGYVEIVNVDPEVRAMHLKLISTKLCPTTLGQVVIDVVVNPPQPEEQSYCQYQEEKTSVLESLKLRAEMVTKTFNTFEGFSCRPVQGAMYAFPKIDFPPSAKEAAKKENKPVDAFYAFQLLENTGICILPGSGFGQEEGTYHIRTTILPQPQELELMLEKFRHFHTQFMAQYL